MMHRSINRKKIYFYLLILLFVSTSFNFNLLKGFREISIINKININGLDKHEEKLVKEKLEIILNANSFFLNKKIILKNLNQFNFLDSVDFPDPQDPITKIRFDLKILIMSFCRTF